MQIFKHLNLVIKTDITPDFTYIMHFSRVQATIQCGLWSTERLALLHRRRTAASADRSLFRLLLAGRRRWRIIATNSAEMLQWNVSYPFTTHPTFVQRGEWSKTGRQLISNGQLTEIWQWQGKQCRKSRFIIWSGYCLTYKTQSAVKFTTTTTARWWRHKNQSFVSKIVKRPLKSPSTKLPNKHPR